MEISREALVAFLTKLDTPTLQRLVMSAFPAADMGQDMGQGDMSDKIPTWKDVRVQVGKGKGQIVTPTDFMVQPARQAAGQPKYMNEADDGLLDQAAYNGS